MTEDSRVKKVFSKAAILEKQKKTQEDFNTKQDEMRKSFERVASTPDGEKLFQYLFLLCGGDKGMLRRDRTGEVSVNDTILTLVAKSVYEDLRFNLSSDTLKKVERHNWEN